MNTFAQKFLYLLTGVLYAVMFFSWYFLLYAQEDAIIEPVVRYSDNTQEESFMESLINSATSSPLTYNAIYQDEVIKRLDRIQYTLNKILEK